MPSPQSSPGRNRSAATRASSTAPIQRRTFVRLRMRYMLGTLHALFSIVFWAYLAVSSVVLFVVALALFVLTFPFDRKGRWLHLFTCFWAHHYVWLNPLWSLSIRGREHIDDAGSPAVLVANHQSLGDILILFGLFRFYK